MFASESKHQPFADLRERIFQRDIGSGLLHEDGAAVEDTPGFLGIQQDPAGFGDFNKKTGVIEW